MRQEPTIESRSRKCTHEVLASDPQSLGVPQLQASQGVLPSEPESAAARSFFRFLDRTNQTLSARKKDRMDELDGTIWKRLYHEKYGECRPFQLITDSPVAEYSQDTKWPRGAVYDNSYNRNFNRRVYDYFGGKPDLKVLDLGCAGGGLVKSILADGFMAVGLEGADAPLRLRSGERDAIPYHLFSCDITQPFEVRDAAGERVGFDVVTAWEVLEHIPEERLSGLITNIRRHLNPGGMFVASVALFPDGDPFKGVVYHVTLKPKDWWLDRWAEHGFTELTGHAFEVQDFVRGHGRGIRDWDPRDGDGFHLVLGLKAALGRPARHAREVRAVVMNVREKSKIHESVSILMPVCNEAGVIEQVIEEWVRDVIQYLPEGSELVFDEAASTDGTREILSRMCGKYPFIRVTYNEKKDGFANAPRRLYADVRCPLVFFTDSDGQYVAADFWKLARFMEQFEVVHGVKLGRKDPLARRFFSMIFNKAVFFLYQMPYIDINSAFRLMRKEVVETILPKLTVMPTLVNAEFLIRAEVENFMIKQVYVTHRFRSDGGSRGLPKGRYFLEGLKAFRGLFDIKAEYRR